MAFTCIKCPEQFLHEEEYESHLGSEHQMCLQCMKQFTSEYFYQVHIANIHCTKEIDSPHLEGVLPSSEDSVEIKEELPEHFLDIEIKEEEEVKKKPHQCHLCEKSYSRRDKLKDHVKKSHQSSQNGSLNTYQSLMPASLEVNNEPVKKPYECQLCDKSYTRKDKLKDHVKKFHGLSAFEQHSLAGSSEAFPKPNQCPMCEKSYTRKERLKEHIRKGHGVNYFSFEKHASNGAVELCQTFEDSSEMKDDKKQNQCPLCEKSYSYRYKLKEHIKKFHGTSEPSSEIQTVDESKDPLEVKTESQAKKKLLHCHLCDKSYGRKYILRKHLRKWHGITDFAFEKPKDCADSEKQARKSRKAPVKCPCCQMVLSNNSCLNRHILRRHKDEQFDWDLNKSSKSSAEPSSANLDDSLDNLSNLEGDLLSDAKTLLQSIMQEPEETTCGLCSKKFETNDELAAHIKVTHLNALMSKTVSSTENDCPLCAQTFPSRTLFMNHSKGGKHIHVLPFCDTCSKNFKSICHFINHLKAKHLDEFVVCFRDGSKKYVDAKVFEKCNFCQENLRRDLMNSVEDHYEKYHQGVSVHRCKICDDSFPDTDSFNRHLDFHEDSECQFCQQAFSSVKKLFKHDCIMKWINNSVKLKPENGNECEADALLDKFQCDLIESNEPVFLNDNTTDEDHCASATKLSLEKLAPKIRRSIQKDSNSSLLNSSSKESTILDAQDKLPSVSGFLEVFCESDADERRASTSNAKVIFGVKEQSTEKLTRKRLPDTPSEDLVTSAYHLTTADCVPSTSKLSRRVEHDRATALSSPVDGTLLSEIDESDKSQKENSKKA